MCGLIAFMACGRWKSTTRSPGTVATSSGGSASAAASAAGGWLLVASERLRPCAQPAPVLDVGAKRRPSCIRRM